jgi:DNA polymerase III sliding clamp (beta) subunit (PCNA family)
MPEIEAVAEASLNGDILLPAMLSVLGYTSRTAKRPGLSGVTLVMGDPMRIAAGDGFRMAYQDLALSFPQDNTVIVPAGSVTALYHLWQKTPRTPPPSDELIPVIMAKKQVTVAFDGKRGLRFDFGGVAIAIVKLIEASPPDWLKLIPKKEPVLQVQFWAPELEVAVRRALPIAELGKGILRMVFNDSTVTISAKHDGREVESKIQAFTTKGKPNKIALSAAYLLNYLAGKDGIVTIAITDPESPVVLKHQRNPNVIIMPMFVQW